MPIVLYASTVWVHKLDFITYRNILLRGQRLVLLMLTGGYKSLSCDALNILTGLMPIDLEARLMSAKYRWRKEGVYSIERSTRLETILKDEWNIRWESSNNCRRLFSYLPTVTHREWCEWLIPEHYLTQVMTGHGRCNAYLKRVGVKDDDRCSVCLVEETEDHIVHHCVKYVEERRRVEAVLRCMCRRFTIKDCLEDEQAWHVMETFLKEIIRLRCRE